MKKKIFYSIAVLLTAGMFFTSCDNVEDSEFSVNDLDIEVAEDDAVAEDVYNSVDAMVDEEVSILDENNYSTNAGLKSTSSSNLFTCKVITVDHPNDTTRFPKVITIDYGDGCTIEINGERFTRKGIIKITITDRWFIEGATRTVEFREFYINEIKVEGKHTVTNMGINDRGHQEFKHQLEDGKLIFNDSLQYTRDAIRIRERVRDTNRLGIAWYVTGKCEGINVEGNRYSHEIIKRLKLIRCERFHYQWVIVEGVIELVSKDKTATLDYGNGACDNTAILTINGVEREIKIRNRYHKRRLLFGSGNGR